MDDQTIQQLLRPVEKQLEESRFIFEEEFRQSKKHLQPLLEHLSEIRGKEIRPALLLLTAGCCGPFKQDHFRMAAVVEMIHTATLVHDDILDEAGMRRKTRTLHSKWGLEPSVLLGDFLFSRAFYLSTYLEDRKLQRILTEVAMEICRGEIFQISQRFNFDLKEEEYLEIIEGKTASLFRACCKLGSFFSEDETEREALTQYGKNVGIAFQLVDDALDILGTEEKVGKSLGTDMKKGNLTLPAICYLAERKGEGRDLIEQLVRNPQDGWQEKLRNLIREAGGFHYTKKRMLSFLDKSRESLRLLNPSEFRTSLEGIAQYVENRFPQLP